MFFFFSSRRRHTRCLSDWSSDVCSSDLELLEHDHGQQAGTGPSSCYGMEWRRRLADRLAVAAAELLPHRLHHFPLTGRTFQRLRHILAELAQPIAAAALASLWWIDHQPLARQMVRKGLALGALARKSANGRCFADGAFRRELVFRRISLELLERQRQLLDQARRALRPLAVNLALKLGDPQLLLGDQRAVLRGLGTRDCELRRNLQPLRPLERQRFSQGGDLVLNRFVISIHATQ